MANRMQDKVVIITGGGSGMGQSSVRIFAEEGANVVIAEINEKTGRAMEEEMLAKGLEAMFVKCDVSSEESTTAMVEAAVAKYGKINSIVNYAALGGSAHSENFQVFGRLWEFSKKDFDRMIDVNLGGTFLITKAVMPVMMEQGYGNIVYCSSLNGLQGILNADAYTASKGGICALTRAVAAGAGEYGIRVNCLCPGVIATPQHGTGWEDMIGKPMNSIGLSTATPINRAGLASEVAYVALYLANDEEASFVTGVNMPVDGGWYAI